MHAIFSIFTAPGSWTPLDVLNHLWQSTAAALAVLVLLRFCDPLSAGTRRALGWMALAKFALPMALFAPLVAAFGGYHERWLESPALTLPVRFAPVIDVAPTVVATSPNPNGVAAAHGSLSSILAAGWITGFVLLFAWWLVRGVRSRRHILAAAQPASLTMERRVAAAARRVGLRRIPRCATVDDTYGAGLLGVFSPVLILPRGLETTLTPDELEAVLLHELIHVQRHDNLWGALQYFLVSLFWFHPLVWLLDRRIALEAEQACDERVLEITGDAEVYATGIMKCVRHALSVTQPGLAAVTTPPIVTRMENILARDARRDRPLLRGAALVAGLAFLGFSGCAGSFTSGSTAAVAPAKPATPPVSATDPRGAPAARIPLVAGEERPPMPRYRYNQQSGTFEVNGVTREKTVTVDFDDQEVRDIVRQVSDYFEVNIIVPETLKAKATVKASNQTWREIFNQILGPTGYTFVEEGTIVKIVPVNSGQAASASQAAKKQVELATAEQEKSGGKDTLSVDFPDENVRNIIRNIGDLFGLNVAMPDTLQGKITIKLRDVTWRQIFRAVLEPAGHTFVEDGKIVRIVRKESLVAEPLTTEVFRLSHARAADLVAVVAALVEPSGGKVLADARSNSLVITARASLMDDVRPAVARLDQAGDQVKAEPKSVEAPSQPSVPVVATPPASEKKPEPVSTPRFTSEPAMNSGAAALGSIAPRVSVAADAPRVALVSAEPASVPPRVIPGNKDFSGFRGIRVYDPGQLDRQPVNTKQVRPQYPSAMRRAGIEGEALIDFIIDTDGYVKAAYAVKSSQKEFADEAIRAVKKWTFKPGRKGSKDVATHMQMPIVFKLRTE